jgi:hypothetical protein
MVCEGLGIGSAWNENAVERAALSLGAPTTRSLPSASTSVIDGSFGRPGASGPGPRSTDLPNMAMVSRVMGFEGLTIGSRDLVLGMTGMAGMTGMTGVIVAFDLAICSSGSKCSAPGAPDDAFAFSRDTVRRWVLGIWATSTAVGSKTEKRRSLRKEARLGEGVLLVHLLAIGEGVVSNG